MDQVPPLPNEMLSKIFREMLFKKFGIKKPITPESVKSISTFDLKEIRQKVPFAKGAAQISIIQNELDKRASKLDAACNQAYSNAKSNGFKVCGFGYKYEDLSQFEKMCHLRLDAPKTKFKCEGDTRISQGHLQFSVSPRRLIKKKEFSHIDQLTHVTIASHIAAIGEYGFSDCRYLKRLDFEQDSNLGYIGY